MQIKADLTELNVCSILSILTCYVIIEFSSVNTIDNADTFSHQLGGDFSHQDSSKNRNM